MLPTGAILMGFFIIVAGSKFLGRNDSYGLAITMMAGGGALIVSGLWMIGARERRRMRGLKREGFEFLPPRGPESSGQISE